MQDEYEYVDDDDYGYDDEEEAEEYEEVNMTLHYVISGVRRVTPYVREDWAREDFRTTTFNPRVTHAHITNNEDGSIVEWWTRK